MRMVNEELFEWEMTEVVAIGITEFPIYEITDLFRMTFELEWNFFFFFGETEEMVRINDNLINR